MKKLFGSNPSVGGRLENVEVQSTRRIAGAIGAWQLAKKIVTWPIAELERARCPARQGKKLKMVKMTAKSRRIRKPEKGSHAKAWSHLLPTGKGTSSAVFNPKSFVFRQGDPSDSVYFIEDGKVQLTVVSKQGKQAVIAILGPDEFFGEGCLAGKSTRTSSASAMTKSTILRIEKSAMTRAIQERPAVAKNFLEFLLSRKAQMEADLVDQLFNSSERRLARLLVVLANFGEGEDRSVSIPRISQEMLAARVGTTRTRINYFMNKFRKLGFIDYNGNLKIHPSLLNMVPHE